MSVNVLFKHEAPSSIRSCRPCLRLSSMASYHVLIASAPTTLSVQRLAGSQNTQCVHLRNTSKFRYCGTRYCTEALILEALVLEVHCVYSVGCFVWFLIMEDDNTRHCALDVEEQLENKYIQSTYRMAAVPVRRHDVRLTRLHIGHTRLTHRHLLLGESPPRILFSDEAHFWLNGYVNKQNCRIWREANPQVYVETPLHPEKLTVWCALRAGGIIGPYVFKNDEGHNVTVNGDRYRAMITNFFIPELKNHNVQELWFQQDGATCHTARATIDLLKDTFGDRLISRFGPVNWPPRSCNLTPLDYFLGDYLKSLIYADKPQTLDHLEDNIRRVIADIRPQMLEKVIENWTSRLDYIRASRGSHVPGIIFTM
ncbi:transposable element Tc3 transposase [Trichonephila clavipes]|nr:transposable element Tc3 transposase [Trichonephila clavipes]